MLQAWFCSNSASARFVQWLAALAVSLVAVVLLLVIVIYVVGFFYTQAHPDALLEKDFGYGLVMMATLSISLICAMPIMAFLAWRVKKAITLKSAPNKALHRKNQPSFRCAALRLFFR